MAHGKEYRNQMWQFDESAAQLPPKQDGEPANLRREIVEELKDHLTCARRREQMADDEQNEEAVRRRVLDRFGDPAAVARKLWLDWMWEKIMTQRILVATCVLMAVISCVALGLAWASLNRQQDMIATWQLTSEKQMRDQQKLFERLLAESQNGKTPSDWNPVELRFVKGKEDGPLAEGINVSMSIEANETGIPPMSGVSNKDGVVRFERVRYGTYHLNVRNSANERFATAFTLQPGEGLTRTIVCPHPPADSINLVPRIDWPIDLKDQPLWSRFRFADVYRPVANERWTQSNTFINDENRQMEGTLISLNGEVLVSSNFQPLIARGPGFLSGRSRSGEVRGLPLRSQGLLIDNLYFPHAIEQPELQSDGIRWPGGDYRIGRLLILVSASGIRSAGDLPKLRISPTGRAIRTSSYEVFGAIAAQAADWTYRIEPGTADMPGTLWLTPNDEAIQKVRAALAEIDQAREAAEKAQSEYERARAEGQQQQPPVAAQEPEKKDGAE